MDVSESRTVRVRGEHGEFVFVAEPDDGRLVIRRDTGDDAEQVCAITVHDREELRGFLIGLRRVLGIEEGQSARPAASAPAAAGRDARGSGDDGSEDREERIRRARQRNPKAFAPWTSEEEQRVAEAAREGRDLAALARELGRSERAVRMRLEKLGVEPDADNVVEIRRTG